MITILHHSTNPAVLNVWECLHKNTIFSMQFMLGRMYRLLFTTWCYASVVLAIVCPSICPSVTHWYCIKTDKCRIMQTMLHDSFWMPKVLAKFERGHPHQGCQMQVGLVKIGDFQQITRFNSVQDRCTVTTKVE